MTQQVTRVYTFSPGGKQSPPVPIVGSGPAGRMARGSLAAAVKRSHEAISDCTIRDDMLIVTYAPFPSAPNPINEALLATIAACRARFGLALFPTVGRGVPINIRSELTL